MGSSSTAQRRRLEKGERKQRIVAAAAAYYARHGFSASTRQIAEAAGITQPLLYSHFPSKEALLRAVYETVYVDRWNSAWDHLLADRGRPLEERLVAFYTDYTQTIFDPDWARLYLQAGLQSLELNRWYLALIEDRVIRRIAREIRAEHGLLHEGAAPIAAEELELVWTFHGGIFHHGMRRAIFEMPHRVSARQVIEASVASLLRGAPGAIGGLIAGSLEDRRRR